MKKILLFLCLFSLPLLAQIRDYSWVTTSSWSNTGRLFTSVQELYGDEWRVVYRGKKNCQLCIYLIDAVTGQRTRILNHTNGILSGQRSLNNFKGKFYLELVGNAVPWTVEIQQYVDRLQEWRYLQSKDISKSFLKIGSIAGEEPDTTDLEITEAPCLIKLSTLTDGLLKMTILDQANQPVFISFLMNTKQTAQSWIYTPGNYKVKVETSDVNWLIDIFTLPKKN